MQRRNQLDASADDLAFLPLNHRRHDLDLCFRPRPHANQFLKYAVILRAAIGISGTVFRHGADINRARAERFRPAHRHGKKMGIAKRYVGYWDCAAMQSWCTEFIFRNRNVLVRKSGAAYRAEMVELHDEPLPHAIEICNVFERVAFALLRALPVPRVKQRKIPGAMPLARNGSANAGVHPSAQKHYRFSHVAHVSAGANSPVRRFFPTPYFITSLLLNFRHLSSLGPR